MRKRPFQKITVEDVAVIDIAEEGKGVGKTENLVMFIENAIPGDVVDVEIYRKKKSFAEAKITRISKTSEYRTDAFCQHFGVCGGCKWQHMTYEGQLKFKQKSVCDALERLGKIDVSGCEPILASKETRYYRNKLEYTFSNKKWLTGDNITETGATENMDALGFHVPLRFDKILNIEKCHLQADPSNQIRNSIRQFALDNSYSFYDLRNHEGNLRNLIIRTSSTGEIMVCVVFAYADKAEISKLMEFVKDGFPQITSLLYIVNQKKNDTIFDQEPILYSGRDHIFEAMPGNHPARKELKFKIGIKSFYQTNSEQAYELYKITREFAGLNGNEVVYDLYTGAGTIANFIADDVKQVIGIEYLPTAIEDAKVNSSLNAISNTLFFAGDMKDILTSEFVQKYGKPDVIITDPPRAGMHPDVVQRLLQTEAEKIVYVSCNAATQARDIALLTVKYEVKRIKPVDMFPHTQHVENVVLLILNSKLTAEG